MSHQTLLDDRPMHDIRQFIADHPEADLSLRRLAARIRLSPRHFARLFHDGVGISPGRYVEGVRLDLARRLLEEGGQTVDAIAKVAGFGNAEMLRRAFHRRLGVSPAQYRREFAHAGGRMDSPDN